MHNLIFGSVVIVGQENKEKYFSKYFKHIIMVPSNAKALKQYHKSFPSLLILQCNETNEMFKIIEKIRANDNKVAIIILTEKINHETVLEIMHLQIFGFLEEPFEEQKVEQLLRKYNVPKKTNHLIEHSY